MNAYSAKKRAAVLATYREKGPAAAARQHGVSAHTATRWAREAGVVLSHELKKSTEAACLSNEQRRERMAVEFGDVALQILKRVSDDKRILAGDVRALLTAAAIAADKHVMLTGAGREPSPTDTDRKRVEDEITSAIVAEAERIARESA